MPANHPRQWVAVQPAIRHADETFRAQVQIAWTPGEPTAVVSVTLLEGDDGDLRSSVVAAPSEWLDVPWLVRAAVLDVLDLARRSSNPFDPLT